jgi:hypothetical protein
LNIQNTLVVWILPLALLAQSGPPDDKAAILSEAKDVLIDVKLGDLEKLPPLSRPEDAPPKELDEISRQVRDDPLLIPVRANLTEKLLAATTLQDPQIAPDGQTAKVSMTLVPEKLHAYLEAYMTYDIYLKEAIRAKRANQPPPDLDIIEGSVKGWILQRSIDARVLLLERYAPPVMEFEKTAAGWRLNLQKYREVIKASGD